MCYNLSAKSKIEQLQKRFEAEYKGGEAPTTYYQISGFTHSKIPIIATENNKEIQLFNWGLIPSWAANEEKANELRTYTLNAKAETIFEKPSFRTIAKKRCLVLVDGFYEWQTIKGKKYPYYIELKNKEPFAMGGLYDEWTNKETGEIVSTFSIITVEANPMMAKIHNSKLRMPFILDKSNEKEWIDPNLTKENIVALMRPYDENLMIAHTISKLITSRSENNNVPQVQDEFIYPELNSFRNDN